MENVAKMNASNTWDEILSILGSTIDSESFATWLQPTRLKFSDNEKIIVEVPTKFFHQWIEANYRPQIEVAIEEITGKNLKLVFNVEGDSGSSDVYAESEVVREENIQNMNKESSMYFQNLNAKYQFDNFVVGESNRFAHAAGLAVSDPDSKAYNPLFIYGGTGLGKTHLMQAIGHKLKEKSSKMTVRYHTSEQFTNSFIDAIQKQKHLEFRNYYRSVDLLLIDDIQFLAGKDRTQIEFFHTFNSLYDAGKKIVVTSDCPPKELSALEERLRSRFEWGLIVDIQEPDIETRIAILKRKAQMEGLNLPSTSINYIAERIRTNIRELEGVLLRLKMYQNMYNKKITLEVIKKMVGHLMLDAGDKNITIEAVQNAVCDYFDLKLSDLIGDSRVKKFSIPRHISQYLCRQITKKSLPEIGLKFKGRDHSSVLHACRKVEKDMENDSNLQNLINYLTKKIKEGS